LHISFLFCIFVLNNLNMDKYYTPEIEEFHVGFEYEVFEKG